MKTRTAQPCWIACLVLAALALCLTAPPSRAIMTKATVPELTQGATGIIRGHVVQMVSQWDDQGKTIFTYTTILVDTWLKGSGPKTITIRTPGGEVGDIGLWVEDMPVFAEGQEVITFLVSSETETVMAVKGLFQGKFTVEEGKVIEAGLPVGDFVNMVASIVKAQEKELDQK